jgi:hypothetical protein
VVDVLPALLIMGLGFGMIFSPAINTATAGVRREDSGVASALVNTMQQVGGSIGTSALSTVALTTTASYLAAHHATPLAPAIAATRGYTEAFAIAAALLGFGVIVAVVLLPSRRRLAELQAAAVPAPGPAPEPATAAAPGAGPRPESRAPAPVTVTVIPVAIVCCWPVSRPGAPAGPGPALRPARR